MNGIVLFEPADLDAAYAELDARFAAGEAAGCARAWAAPCAFAAAWNARDFDALWLCDTGLRRSGSPSTALGLDALGSSGVDPVAAAHGGDGA